MIYLKEPQEGKSPTLTLLYIGVGAALLKLLIADSEIMGITFGPFSGADFALVVTPFLATYSHKRYIKAKQKGD